MNGIFLKDDDMKNKRNQYLIFALVVLACLAMYMVEVHLSPSYWLKSMLKLTCFGGCILLYRGLGGHGAAAVLRLPAWRKLLPGLGLGLLVYALILAGYFGLRSIIDLSAIAANLQQQGNINGSNFIFVALYICLVNSGLEELFFRGLLSYN